jgi:hypothetical protein
MASDDSVDSDAIRGALGRLCTRGVVPWWIRDKAPVLLELRCVKARATKNTNAHADPDEVNALVEILREQVGSMRDHSYGEILWVVLGLEDRYLGLNARARRAIAGRDFRKGEQPVTAETIRQLHEKAALDHLTVRLADLERRFRAGLESELRRVSPERFF